MTPASLPAHVAERLRPMQQASGSLVAATTFAGWAGLASANTSAHAVLAAIEGSAAIERNGASLRPASFGRVAASGPRAFAFRANDAVVVICGRPRWEGARLAADALGRAVLDAYRQRGQAMLESLGGSFSLVLLDNDGRDVLLAVDRAGVGTLAYAAVDDGIVFGSSVPIVEACREAQTRVDAQSLFNYVFLHVVPGPRTILEGVRRLPPGGCVTLRNGAIEVGRYWRMRYVEDRDYDLDALKREFRALLERAVADCAEGGTTGAFLSGGTDSSTIAGVLTQVTNRPARTYSIGFAEEGYDEMAYARIAAKHFGTEHHEYYVTPDDVFALAARVAAHCDQPFANASAVPVFYCADYARRDGVLSLLGGDGGDELFGGNERYATQAMLSWYSRIPPIVRRALVEPALDALAFAHRVPLVRKARGYVAQARQSPPEQLHAYNMFRRLPLGDVFTPEFLARVDPGRPLALMLETYDQAAAATPLNRMLALDLEFTLADNDLFKVRSMCELAGVQADFPMLDDSLMAFSARLPSHLKLRGLTLRYFFKEALRDFLPHEIIVKRKHGFGLPVGIWMKSHAPLRELMYDAVRALGERGLVQRAFVERLIAGHQNDSAAYWGAQIWSFAQLELWLAQHGFAPSQPVV